MHLYRYVYLPLEFAWILDLSRCLPWVFLSLPSLTSVVKCEPPPDIRNGRHSGEEDFYTYGFSVTYSCDSRFSLLGHASISCTVENKTTGVWRPSPPTCESKSEWWILHQNVCSLLFKRERKVNLLGGKWKIKRWTNYCSDAIIYLATWYLLHVVLVYKIHKNGSSELGVNSIWEQTATSHWFGEVKVYSHSYCLFHVQETLQGSCSLCWLSNQLSKPGCFDLMAPPFQNVLSQSLQ